MGRRRKTQVVGHRYNLGVHFVLCHGPVDALTEIKVDGKRAWTGYVANNQSININAPTLFGGEDREGGIGGELKQHSAPSADGINAPNTPNASQWQLSRGKVDIMLGFDTQQANSYLQRQLGANKTPAYRRVVSVILNSFYMGNSPYMRPWAFRVQRALRRLNGQDWPAGAMANWARLPNNDMNPANILYEVLTDADIGLGYTPDDLHLPSFEQAAQQLYTENMGMSIIWETSQKLTDFIGIVLKHIDGSLFLDRQTGKMRLALVRQDPRPDSELVHLGEKEISKFTSFKRATNAERPNQVTVIYWDKAADKDGAVTVQDPAAIERLGGRVVPATVQYPGFTEFSVAQRVAQRDLQAMSSPLASCVFLCSTKGNQLNVGDRFILSWPDYGLKKTYFRVVNLELGTLTNNQVRITAVEDAFSTTKTQYVSPPVTAWVPPVVAPRPSPVRIVQNAPYLMAQREFGEAALSNTDLAGRGFMLVAGSKPNSAALSAVIRDFETSPFDFSPVVTSKQAIPADQSADDNWVEFEAEDWQFLSAGVKLEDIVVNQRTLEYMQILQIDGHNKRVRLLRGIAHTTPQSILQGDKLLVLGNAAQFCTVAPVYGQPGQPIGIKILTRSLGGQLESLSAPQDNVLFENEWLKPYPPGRVHVQYNPGSQYFFIEWARRSRMAQVGAGLQPKQSDGPIASVNDTLRQKHVVEIWKADGSQRLYRGIIGIDTSRVRARVATSGQLEIRLSAIYDDNPALESTFKQVRTLSYNPSPVPGTTEVNPA